MDGGKNTLSIGCVVMAAGNAKRFGANKLLEEFEGKSLIHRALEAVPAHRFCSVTVVAQHAPVVNLAKDFGFSVIENNNSGLGLSHTVRLGTQALAPRCDAIMYLVADQPLLRRESVEAALDFFCAHSDRIIAMKSGDRRGNPCIFPARFFDELMALTGDHGGRSVIEAHEDALELFTLDEKELIDVDTRESFESLKKEA
ncbi:MAG: nucleotidyltransferase family protein [Oscillospiraceae bacterium]|nr:nucleotidyltransferase family protein [Oscillospiraceae bacterium]